MRPRDSRVEEPYAVEVVNRFDINYDRGNVVGTPRNRFRSRGPTTYLGSRLEQSGAVKPAGFAGPTSVHKKAPSPFCLTSPTVFPDG